MGGFGRIAGCPDKVPRKIAMHFLWGYKPRTMRSIKNPLAVAAFVLVGMCAISCTNRDGAGGTSDGTSAEGYELRSQENLAPPMDAEKTSPVDSTAANKALADSSNSGEQSPR